MPNTYVDDIADAAQTDFAFTFPFLEDEHVTVEIDGAVQLTSAYSIVTSPSQKIVLNVGATAGQVVRVRRKSQPDTNLVDFVNGSVLTESELDRAYQHNRYLAEEIAELNDASLQLEQGGTQWDAKSLRIKNVGTPTLTTDATTKDYVDTKVNQASTGASSPPQKFVFTGTAGANTTYTVTGAEVLGDTAYDVSIDGAVKEPTTDFTVDPDTDTLTIIPTLSGGEDIVVIERGFGVAVTSAVGTNQIQNNAVTTAKLANDSVTTAKIEDDSVTNAKIADDSIDSEHYVDGSIDTAHIADNQITAAKISDTDSIFNINSLGNVGIGVTAGAGKLSLNGDLVVTDTSGDNLPVALFRGSAGAVVQLNDQSTNGQIFNISSTADAEGRGGFSLGHIATAGSSVTITHVSNTTTLSTFSTASAHGLKEGIYVSLSGSSDSDWNAVVEVVDVPSTTTFVVPKISSTTNYPTTLTPNDSYITFSIRRHEESNVLSSMIKMVGLPKDIDNGGVAGTQPSWLEPAQLWIDTTDNSIKINPETTT